jgi:hypothetical protein
MAPICDSVIHLCAVRVTRLDSLGNPVAGPNNVYVSDNPIQVVVKPEIEAGADKTVTGGCDCIIASYKGFDKLKRFGLEMDLGVIEPAMLEMMLGADAILAGSAADPIGLWWPSQLSCDEPNQPNVCFEGWQTLWEDDHPASGAYQYVHWIWPSTYWQIADHTLQNDFLQPKLNGFSRANPNWGLGIYGDLPEAAGPLGGFFYDSDIPTAECGWQSHSIT